MVTVPVSVLVAWAVTVLILGSASGQVVFFLLGRTRRCRHDRDAGRAAVERREWRDTDHQTRPRQLPQLDRPGSNRRPPRR